MKGEPDLGRIMVKMIEATLRSVRKEYPAGCLTWLRETDPSRIGELKALIPPVKAAFLAVDPAALKQALRTYHREHLRTFGAYLGATVAVAEEET